MSDPAVRVEVRADNIAVLTIDQPGAKVNVLTVALWDELEAALDALAVRTDVAGLVVASGKPGCFIAGADLNLLATATPGDPAVKAFIAQGLRVLAKLEALPYPTCAAIDGVALGGGLEVALACDHQSFGSHPKVSIGLPEVNLGLIPGWGGTQRAPRVLGIEPALRLLLTGVPLVPATTNVIFELATESEVLIEWSARVVLSASLNHRSLRLAGWTLDSVPAIDIPPLTAAREAYRVLTEGFSLPLADGIALETEAFLRLAGSDESRAKIAAFFAARKR